MKKLRLTSSSNSLTQPEMEVISTGFNLAGKLRIVPSPPTSPATSPNQPSNKLKIPTPKPERILCFDIENKPGTYGPGDYTHPKVTAIAAQFLDEDSASVWALERDKPRKMRRDVEAFLSLWDRADGVMGHNIRRHDIRILNGLLVPLGLPILQPKRMIDTFSDAPKTAGFSRSLENLCARYGCPIEKLNMPEHMWEMAYDGVAEGVERMKLRVSTDVQMNIWLFHYLCDRGLLCA